MVYKDKLQNCSCNQFHYIGTYKQVEKNCMAKNRGGNNGSEKWIEKTLRLHIVTVLYATVLTSSHYFVTQYKTATQWIWTLPVFPSLCVCWFDSSSPTGAAGITELNQERLWNYTTLPERHGLSICTQAVCTCFSCAVSLSAFIFGF